MNGTMILFCILHILTLLRARNEFETKKNISSCSLQDKWHRLPSMIPTSSVNLNGREDVLKFISSIILFRRRKNKELKESRRRQRIKVGSKPHPFLLLGWSLLWHFLPFHQRIASRGLTHATTRFTQYNPSCNLSNFFSLFSQAKKAPKPQKHRVRKSEREGGHEGRGDTFDDDREYIPKPKLSMQEIIAQELAEVQRGESGGM